MSTIFDRFKSSAERAAFEADKVRRIAAIQNRIRSTKGKYEAQLPEAGRVAYELYRQQASLPQALEEVCRQLEELLTQVAAMEQEIEEIRAEEFVQEEESAPLTEQEYGHICPNGHGPLPAQHRFCQKCGAEAIDVPPPPKPEPAQETWTCAKCGTVLKPGMSFCSGCGSPVSAPSSPRREVVCGQCGAPVVEGARFCNVCGNVLVSDAPAPATRAPEQSDAEVESTDSSFTAVSREASMVEESVELAGEAEAEDVDEPVGVDIEPEIVDSIHASIPAEVDPFPELEENTPQELEESTTERAEIPDSIGNEAEIAAEDRPSEETPAPALCPICNKPLVEGARFCGECGYSITA